MGYKNQHYKRDWMRRWRAEHPSAASLQQKRSNNRPLTEEEKKRRTDAVRAWQRKNPERFLAQQAIYYALKHGKLQKGTCWCGETKVEAHHVDYTKRLDVEWLCRKH